MSSEIKHQRLNEDSEISDNINNNKIESSNNENNKNEEEENVKNTIPKEELTKEIKEKKQPESESESIKNNLNIENNHYQINQNKSNKKMDNDMNQKIFFNDLELGDNNKEELSNQSISMGKEEKTNTSKINYDNSKNNDEDTSIQRKIAGGMIDSVKRTFTNSFETCLYTLPKLGKPYFDVNPEIIKNRLIQGVVPYPNTIYETTIEKPDLYGPFWIYTSVVFCLAASGSLYQFFHGHSKDRATTFAEFVSVTSFWIYLIGFVFPLVIYLLLKYVGSTSVTYMNSVCIYGYTFAVFIPVSVLCVFFSSFFDWIFLLYSGASSSFILIKAYSRFFNESSDRNKKYMILAFIAIFQIILIWFMSHYFFNAPTEKVINAISNPTKNSVKENSSNIASSSKSDNLKQGISKSEDKKDDDTHVNTKYSDSEVNTQELINNKSDNDINENNGKNDNNENNELDNLASQYKNNQN